MATGLLQGAKMRFESAKIQLEQIHGNEVGRIIEGVEVVPFKLEDEPIVRFIAFTGAHVFRAGSEEDSVARSATCERLRVVLQELQDELGKCVGLEKVLKELEN